ncbi:hypothetical protein [Erythrobacter mangrovi]|uniref:Uncharacterized protein n=1 Tax=Erythrobacter mangrovi TaxID=2739433 RepID=A0A7D3XN34_9SPHN|nr:hypothetical protein [Erythrobacter mangrovi]QKG70034.1 hypothetical protein HQR01_00855 [Erythrobacter mangrovi]
MSQQSYEFYVARAEASAAEAKVATLENVRERALRAEATWMGLAKQARAVAKQRMKIETEKAAARAAAAEELAAQPQT